MIRYENLNKVNQPFYDELEQAFSKVLREGYYILGDSVSSFEQNFARYCGAKYCIGVGSGLDAITLALDSLDLKKASEVIVAANTYIATIFSILHAGLKPVLVEPDINTYNIDPNRIEEKMSKKTSAIVVVHLYGKPCNMAPILGIAEKYGCKVVEDCAQAHGAKYFDRFVGTLGNCGAYSFYPTKNLGAIGDAGAVLTDDFDLYEKIRKLRNYGSAKKNSNQLVGYNSRLDEIQAAFLNVKLRKLDLINNHKRKLAGLYSKYIEGDFVKPATDEHYHDVYHIYPVRHTRRDELVEYLKKNEVETAVHYPIPPHEQAALRDILDDSRYPISEEIHNTIVSLPISYSNTEEDIFKVIEVLNGFR